ncbi:MAG: hypothetical protein ACREX3_09165 [Gammaproteobacteria bacterium]
MSVQWLAVQSFQHNQDLLAAINKLSIHLRLQLEGNEDAVRAGEANKAREMLSSFFRELETLVKDTEGGEDVPVLGANPRLRQLARSFVRAKRNRRRFRSSLFRNGTGCFQQLLHSNTKEDRQALLESLEDLRVLVEEHMHVDMERVLGEI